MSNLQRRLIVVGVFLLLFVGVVLVLRFVDLGGGGEEEDLTVDLADMPEPLFPDEVFATVTYVRLVDNESRAVFQATGSADDSLAWVIDEKPEITPTPTPEASEEAEGEAGEETGGEADEEAEAEISPDEMVPDPMRILSAAGQLASITPTRTLSQVEALSTYGLGSSPHYTIEFSTNMGNDYTLYVGEQNPAGTSYYVQLPDEPEVYLVSSYTLSPLLEFLTDPPLTAPTPTPTATATPEGEGDTGES
jgi:hypothetical protein